MGLKKRPAYRVYTVEDIDEDNSYWSMVGVAFSHQDKLGMNILLKALPIDGRLVLRKYTETTPDKVTDQPEVKAATKAVAAKRAAAKAV